MVFTADLPVKDHLFISLMNAITVGRLLGGTVGGSKDV